MDTVHTKIVCTMGTSEHRDSVEFVMKLINAGMDVARVNMSHSPHFRDEGEYIPGKTYQADTQRIARIREAAAKTGRQIAILGDLMGQKIRIGSFSSGEVQLHAHDQFRLYADPKRPGSEKGVFINYYDSLAKAFSPGAMFLFSDGLIRMKAVNLDLDDKAMVLEVLDNGILRSNQGVVLRGMTPDVPGFTKKDREDLKFLLDMEVDFIAVSYIRSADEIIKIRGLIETMVDSPHRPMIIAKIETENAIDDINRIINESDGIMVARGDLGVRMDIEDVPILQKQIIQLCNVLGKPVITATQMLESMINRPNPTRAEVTDIANAILDGTDAVMLSGETAIGDYPVETVEMMRKVAKRTECAMFQELKTEISKRDWRKRIELGITELKEKGIYPIQPNRQIADSITLAAAEIAEDLDLKTILSLTTSGNTARLMARFRPGVSIIAAVNDERIARQLLLSHAVFPALVEKKDSVEQMLEEAYRKLLSEGILHKNDLFLATSGFPPNTPGTTNLLKVLRAW